MSIRDFVVIIPEYNEGSDRHKPITCDVASQRLCWHRATDVKPDSGVLVLVRTFPGDVVLAMYDKEKDMWDVQPFRGNWYTTQRLVEWWAHIR